MSRKTSSSPPPAPRTQLGLSASLRRLGISTNLRKAERQGRHDHKVDIDDDGSTPWTSAEFERCHEAERLISAELHDVVAPIDSRLAVDAERLRQLRELMAAPPPAPGAPPPDQVAAYRERRAAREEAARARQRRVDLQDTIDRIGADLETRRHLVEQAADIVRQVAAVGNARVSGGVWFGVPGGGACSAAPVASPRPFPPTGPAPSGSTTSPCCARRSSTPPRSSPGSGRPSAAPGRTPRGDLTISEPPSDERRIAPDKQTDSKQSDAKEFHDDPTH